MSSGFLAEEIELLEIKTERLEGLYKPIQEIEITDREVTKRIEKEIKFKTLNPKIQHVAEKVVSETIMSEMSTKIDNKYLRKENKFLKILLSSFVSSIVVILIILGSTL